MFTRCFQMSSMNLFCGNVILIAFLSSLAQAGTNIIHFSMHFGTGQWSVLYSFHFRFNNFFFFLILLSCIFLQLCSSCCFLFFFYFFFFLDSSVNYSLILYVGVCPHLQPYQHKQGLPAKQPKQVISTVCHSVCFLLTIFNMGRGIGEA